MASTRRYPLVLRVTYQTVANQDVSWSETVHNETEYNSFHSRYGKERQARFTEIKTPADIESDASQTERDNKMSQMAEEKLQLDIANAKRVYNSYPMTRFFAWTGGILGIILGYLKIAELLKLWPYANK